MLLTQAPGGLSVLGSFWWISVGLWVDEPRLLIFCTRQKQVHFYLEADREVFDHMAHRSLFLTQGSFRANSHQGIMAEWTNETYFSKNLFFGRGRCLKRGARHNVFLSCTWTAGKRCDTLLNLCAPSLRRGNILCIVRILADDLRRGSTSPCKGNSLNKKLNLLLFIHLIFWGL